ncbi:MAG: hypothetical protein JW774_03030 [Candidatus Aureabacteria bacterium]|nr:hypothetical protein [Candidatus Auribacterota bacterium]
MRNPKNKSAPFILSAAIFCLVMNGCSPRERKVVIPPEKDTRTEKISVESGQTEVFNQKEWKTNLDFKPIGSLRAVKGGSISIVISDFPPTYRTFGKDTALMILSLLESLAYESLLSLDPETLNYRPNLATHWKISEDKSTYWFRLDPEARWANGEKVTSYDVVATFRLLMDEQIEDPSRTVLYTENFVLPVAESDSVVRVKCRKVNWRSFMYFASQAIFPFSHVSKVDGESYLKKHQFQMMPGSGPYELDSSDTVKGRNLVIKRRKNYWAINKKQNLGLYNFDEIRFVVVSDERLQLEKFKKGEFDLYMPSKAQWWIQELDPASGQFPAISRGLVLKRKIFNFEPLGMTGLAFNTLVEPFDDIRVRQAFSCLWNVDQLIDKLFFNEYVRCKSWFQGSVYENPDNPMPSYDPQKAMELLDEAGWIKKPGEPWRTKDGKIFELTLSIDAGWDRIFTPFQEDLEKAGIKLNLVNMSSQSIFEKVMKREFTIAYQGWTGLLFPNPESSLHSKFSEMPESVNITGMKNKRVDDLCEQYDQSYDAQERISIIREMDGIISAAYHYAFGWIAPYSVRIAFWNKFGHPDSGLSYTGDWTQIPALWWVDPEKEKMLNKARQDETIVLPRGRETIDFWNKLNKKGE